jgi:nitroreductase
MKLGLTADEVLTTTRAVRKRLDLSRPVEREVVLECLEIALQAPTGSFSQGWSWMFVTDPDKKRAIAEYYGANFDAYRERSRLAAFPEGDLRAERRDAIRSSSDYLRDHFHEVPVLLIPLLEGRLEGLPVFGAASSWGSLLPAVWSFMLALRERGLGSAWTTLHLPNEREVAELLGIPFDRYTQAGLFPIAYTIGTDFKPAPRLDVDELVHWDTW